ncbi:hypothetical protein C5E10_12785 [Pseudoclavibacter sp. RFBG4]|nr:hypothetical protein C5E10_12785 [Pseudoclavibacter sp. RFBG4]
MSLAPATLCAGAAMGKVTLISENSSRFGGADRMGIGVRVWKSWIWPGIKIALVAVIAVALVKIAFFSSAPEESAALPTGQVVEPVISPVLGTITNDVTLTANVQESPAVDAKVPMMGTIDTVYVTQGARVEAGDVIAAIRNEKTPTAAAPSSPEASGEPQAAPAVEPEYEWNEIVAPTAGTITKLNLIEQQQVTVGEAPVSITPASFIVKGTIPPAQLYRLATTPADAQVTITAGPAPFTCTELRIASGAAAKSSSAAEDPSGASGAAETTDTTTVTCKVPAEVTVFPGLEANVVLHGGVAENVLTLPITAVKGQAETGVVFVQGADGAVEERPVKLGLTDGTLVQVAEGVSETDIVLEFVPGADQASPEECYIDPMSGAEICGMLGG